VSAGPGYPVVVGQAPGSFVQNDAAEPERPAPPVVDVPVLVSVEEVSVGLVVESVLGAAPPVSLVVVTPVAPVLVSTTPVGSVSVPPVSVSAPVSVSLVVLDVDEVDEVLPGLLCLVDVAADCVAAPVVGTVNAGAPPVSEALPPLPQPASSAALQSVATSATARRARIGRK